MQEKLEMVFCYQNCSHLLQEKIALEFRKKFAKILRSLEQFIQTVKRQNNFLLVSGGYLHM